MIKRIRSESENKNEIIVVSGLPRSGTSMMMKVLEAGGVSLLIDNLRKADQNNPRGYYEFEPVKKLQDEDVDWLDLARGKAVKIISPLLSKLPDNYRYKVVFMERSLDEILASQRKMLMDRGKDPDTISDDELKGIFIEQLQLAKEWAEQQGNIDYIVVDYNRIIQDPENEIVRVNRFIDRDLQIQEMKKVVDPSLYRHRI